MVKKIKPLTINQKKDLDALQNIKDVIERENNIETTNIGVIRHLIREWRKGVKK